MAIIQMALSSSSTDDASSSCCSVMMRDISRSWDKETIALLLGKSLHFPPATAVATSSSSKILPGSVRVELVAHPRPPLCNGNGLHDNPRGDSDDAGDTRPTDGGEPAAIIEFASRGEMERTVEAYRGTAIPMTHGYHYYAFEALDCRRDGIEGAATTTCMVVPAAGGGASPPLHQQIMALPTKEIERRLKNFSDLKGSNDAKGNKGGPNKKAGRVHKHALLSHQLCTTLGVGTQRATRHVRGVPVPPGSTQSLLSALRSFAHWPPPTKQRRGVSAGNYLTVRRQHPAEHDELWELCRALITAVVPDAVYGALAITKSFRGSPHVDRHDRTYQHVIAVGDFTGGELCAECDDGGSEVMAIDVRDRFGRIDGRAVHWVNGWEGERYSVVYYSTAEEDYTERASQEVHTEWMESMQPSST